jgi:hypothetical protein
MPTKKAKVLCSCLSIASAFSLTARAQVNNDATIVNIYPSGNPSDGWTSSTDNGLTLALQADNNSTGAVPNANNGTYSFATGTTPGNPGHALWNIAFSVENPTSVGVLGLDTYWLVVSGSASSGPINLSLIPDNAYGTSATLHSQGTEGAYATTSIGQTIMQNTENQTFAFLGGDNPSANATYTYDLYATPISDTTGLGNDKIDEVEATVIVGTGAAAAPDTASTLGLLAIAAAGMGFVARKIRGNRSAMIG